MNDGSPARRHTRRWGWTDWLLTGQIAVLASANGFWGLSRSVWLDESLTWWAASGSVGQLVQRSVEYQGQTPFFFLTTWPMVELFGANEMTLRLPSVALLLLSTLIVYRIGAVLVDRGEGLAREGGLLAALLFQGLWGFRFGPPDARPYALAICMLLLATLFVVEWDRGRRAAAWGYVAAILASIYAHVLMAPAILLHLVYLAAGRELRSRWAEWTGPCVAFALGALPVVYVVLRLRSKWELYSFAPMPTGADLFSAWKAIPVALVLCGGIFLLGGPSRRIKWKGPGVSRRDWALLWGWAVLPALTLFVVSHLRGLSVFVPRYHGWQVPGMALLIALLISGFAARSVRLAMGGLYFSAALLVILLRPVNDREDWRGAVAYANREIASDSTPVLVWSGLVESRNLEWLQLPESQSYVLAPASFYGLRGLLVPVPDPASVEGLPEDLPPSGLAALQSASTVWLVARHRHAARAMAEWVSPMTLDNATFEQFGEVTVAQLRRE